ncbi:MAG: 3-dehydroquinate synthase [Acidobacteria bacterium]|nr:3-dehydroquinate synthase [Acidobacteriota bacterium]
MQELTIRTAGGISQILVGRQLFADMPRLINDSALPRPRAVISNTTVGPLWGRDVGKTLDLERCTELPDGEEHKVWTQVEGLCAQWLEMGLHRSDTILAIGGGVVTDCAGFAASIYMRGVKWIAAPTTLLAMVDASVGGKTGVNLAEGKNLLGTFWQPSLVVADIDTLETLPERELRAGLAEVIKSAWIGDRDLLDLIDPSRPISDPLWEELVMRTIQVKARIVEEDEREVGVRKALNLGHTLGHALEAATGYKRFLHGEAIAWGMRAVAAIAAERGLLANPWRRQLEAAIDRLGPLPPIVGMAADRILHHLSRDKKSDDLGVGWVLPSDGGVVLDQRVSLDEVQNVLETLGSTPAV